MRSLGVDVLGGQLGDMEQAGVWEPLQLKRVQMQLATEAAIAVLKIDAIHQAR